MSSFHGKGNSNQTNGRNLNVGHSTHSGINPARYLPAGGPSNSGFSSSSNSNIITVQNGTSPRVPISSPGSVQKSNGTTMSHPDIPRNPPNNSTTQVLKTSK